MGDELAIAFNKKLMDGIESIGIIGAQVRSIEDKLTQHIKDTKDDRKDIDGLKSFRAKIIGMSTVGGAIASAVIHKLWPK